MAADGQRYASPDASTREARASACILPDVRQFAISNNNGEDKVVLERPIRGFDFPLSEAGDQNPVSLRYEFRGCGG
jgi:hypothetical protein